MKNKVITLILVFIICFTSMDKLTFAKKNEDVFNDILITAKGNTVEYGIRANFEINIEPEEYCLSIIKAMGLDKGNILIKKDEENYSIEFNKNEIKGYIECSSYDNHNVVTFNIIKSDNENKLKDLKYEVEKTINRSNKEVKYFQYLKAKLSDNDLSQVNNNIDKMLKQQNVKNIYSVNIENGYSTVAYTKQFDAMKNNGKLMDLNYAICNYSSGSYIIIGTPIIIESY